ncbi:MAG TPA: protein translocase subunit SecD [Ignavibacteriaceae bacterium]|nr:protein translocase subunit SecD [Ignavibacteriaceae bacterium]
MKEFRFKIIIILGVIALCLYLLYPTFVDYQNTKVMNKVLDIKRQELKKDDPSLTSNDVNKRLQTVEDSMKNANPSFVSARSKRIKLGLDLQGGMRIVLEVNTAKLLEKLAKNPDNTFKQVMNESEKEAATSEESIVDIMGRRFQQRGIRLSRYFGNIRQDDATIISDLKKDADDAVSRAIEIIRNRVDQYGVSEPSIQRQGTRRIIVELPGVAREEEAKQLLQGTALLEFKLLKDPDFTFSVMKKIDNVLAGKSIEDTTAADTSKTKTSASNDTSKVTSDTNVAQNDTSKKQLSEEEFAKEHPFFAIAMIDPQGRSADAYVREDQRNKLELILNRPDVQRVIPDNIEFDFSAKPVTYQDGQPIYQLYCVNKKPELTGGVITNAQANIDPNTSQPEVNMEMNSEGAAEWARITGANVNHRISIILDGLVYSAPNVQTKITGGRSQITGIQSMDEAKLLEIVLKAGALPAPVDIIEDRVVGPSLGQDSINAGFSSAVIGYIIIGIFMIFYYQRAGTIAAASLVFTILFILGILAGFNATLTLPGIAGIILTIGMAVDANVLIYERIREELSTGKTIKASVDSGFSKAYSAIIDSNITTFITGIILYQFGTGPIKGFALTLMIGIAASMFSALVIARLVFDLMVAKGQKITIG